jgi:hypothetical protein
VLSFLFLEEGGRLLLHVGGNMSLGALEVRLHLPRGRGLGSLNGGCVLLGLGGGGRDDRLGGRSQSLAPLLRGQAKSVQQNPGARRLGLRKRGCGRMGKGRACVRSGAAQTLLSGPSGRLRRGRAASARPRRMSRARTCSCPRV